MALVDKIDSNSTGLRFCEEASLGVLPAAAAQLWYPAEPNSYSDFGGQVKTLARRPINASRQNQKGVIVDLDASGGYNTDVTKTNTLRLLRGFFFAAMREPYDSYAIEDSSPVVDIAVDGTANDYESAAFGLGGEVIANHLLFASGFAIAANNGLKVVDALVADTGISVTDTGLLDEALNANGRVQVVGYQFASGTLDVSMASSLPRLTRASGAVDFTTIGLIPGSFIYIGGDSAPTEFVADNNNGWARVRSVAATYIELDKTTATFTTEVGAALTIRIFFGKVLKNETAESGLIVTKSFQWERDLGQKENTDTDHQGEYLVGSIANEYTLNLKQADKLHADLSFVSIDHETVDQSVGLKSATAPATAVPLVSEDAFNATSHVARTRMTILSPTDANPTPLFGFMTDFNIKINNNVKPSKAIGYLGAFAVTAGQFDVSGEITAYFSDVAAVQSVRDNEDVTMDVVFVRDNYGVAYDIPLVSLGNGRLDVTQDNPITLPLEMNAAEDRTFHHTLLTTIFNYLPDVAMG